MPSKSNPQSGNKYLAVERVSNRDSRKTITILLVILALGLLNVYLNPLQPFFNDVMGVESVNGCPLLTFAGIPCPMCGMGRVFSCMTDMNLERTFYYNPLGLVFYILIGFVFCLLLGISMNKYRLILKKPAQKLWYIPVLFLIVMWILNILYGHHH
jgi:hypothetical protein